MEEEAIPIKTVKKKMSFESYYNDWKSIATSVAAEKPVALESTFQKPKNLYYFDRKQLKTDEMQRIMQTYQDLYFGKMPSKKFIKSRKDALDKQNAKLNQHVSRAVEISQSQSKSVVEETQRLLQKISDKLPDKSQSSESRKSSYLTTDEDDSDSEWEKEADGLLDWSEGLESAQQF